MKREDTFRLICGITVITGIVILVWTAFRIFTDLENGVFAAGGAASGVVQICAGITGLFSLKKRKLADKCQILGILMLASVFIAAVCNVFGGESLLLSGVSFAAALIEGVFYYSLSKAIMSSNFWEGIKAAELDKPIGDAGAFHIREYRRAGDAEKLYEIRGDREGKTAKVEVTGSEAFFRRQESLPGSRFIVSNMENIKHCSASIIGEGVIGTLMYPGTGEERESPLRCGFYLNKDELIFIDDSGQAAFILAELNEMSPLENETTGQVFFEFLEYMVGNDFMYLAEYEKRLDILEDNMTDDALEVPKDFDGFVSETRKEMRSLTEYYKLLQEVADVLEEAFTQMEEDRSRQLFASFSDKAGRLFNDAADIAEYALQIRDIYQSKISLRQNKVMQILTIVTTVFMPLTLITGWYGMNFKNMPELDSKYGYFIIAIISIIVISVEFIIFKIKKWF